MYRFVNVLITVIFIFYSCNEISTSETSKSETLAFDTLDKLIKTRINPLVFNEDSTEIRKILDSLQPFIVNASYQTVCTWLLAKASEQSVEDEYDSARFFIDKAFAIAERNDDEKLVMIAKATIGSLFTIRKQWDSALQYVHEAYYLGRKYDTVFPNIYYRLFEIYSAIGDRAAARKYAYEGFENSKYDPYFNTLFVNAIATYYDEIQETDSAIIFFQSLDEDNLFYSKHLIALKNENLGVLLTRKQKPQEALSYLLKAMPLNKELGIFDPLSMYNLANVYSQLKQYKKSFAYLDTALRNAQIAKDFTMIRQIWYLKAQNYTDLRQLPLALSALDSAYSIYRIEMDSSIAKNASELATQYSLKEKEDKISSLAFSNLTASKINHQRKIIIITMGIVMLLVAIIVVLLWRRRQMQTLMREAELRQQLLRSQIDTHFAFNSLTILKSFIRKDLKERSISYLDDFSDLLRLTIENARESFVSLGDEVTALQKYLSIQAVNFDGKFDYDIKANIDCDTNYILVPPMLLQPFVENAILHGISALNYKGNIVIQLQTNGDILQCIIEDNGIGLRHQLRKGKRSISTLITQERLAILSRKTRKPGKLLVIDKQSENEGTGVKVILHIPYRK